MKPYKPRGPRADTSPTDLRAKIVALGISQLEYARRIGVDGTTVRKWLSGKHKPEQSAVDALDLWLARMP